MTTTRSAKPLVSSLVALAFVLSFVLPFLSAIRYGVVGFFFILWLGIQLFWKAPTEATKLGLAASATIFWLSLIFFFGFKDPNFANEGYRGAAAFFALMGGLGIVLLWTRFLADDVTF